MCDKAPVKRKKIQSGYYQQAPKIPLTFSLSSCEKKTAKCNYLVTQSTSKQQNFDAHLETIATVVRSSNK